MNTGNRQIVGLDLIRFAAALMVMAYHLTRRTPFAGAGRWGWVGVEVFFVVSGFVIAYTSASSSPGRFLRNRIVRLMPAVWICGSISALIWAVRGGMADLLHRYMNTLVLWPVGPWVDGVYWTLPVEIVFYGLVFLLLAAGAFRRIGAVSGALAIYSTAYLVGMLLNQRLGLGFTGLPDDLAGLSLAYYGCYFALGVSLWLIFFEGSTVARLSIAGVALVGGVIQIDFTNRGFSATAPLAAPEVVWLLAVVGISVSAWQADRIARWAAPIAPWARRLGLATYPLYLLHDNAGALLRDSLPLPRLAAVVITGAAFIGAALVVALFIEPPVQRRMRARLEAAARVFPTRPRYVSSKAGG